MKTNNINSKTVILTFSFQSNRGWLTASNNHNLFYPRVSGKLGVRGQISDKTSKRQQMSVMSALFCPQIR